MAHLKRPELKLVGNVSENFKNFELRFNDYCIQANYRNLAKDPLTEQADHYKSTVGNFRLAFPRFQTKLYPSSGTQSSHKFQQTIRRNHGSGWTNYARTIQAPQAVHYSPIDSSFGRPLKPQTSPYRNGRSRYAKQAAYALMVS